MIIHGTDLCEDTQIMNNDFARLDKIEFQLQLNELSCILEQAFGLQMRSSRGQDVAIALLYYHCEFPMNL